MAYKDRAKAQAAGLKYRASWTPEHRARHREAVKRYRLAHKDLVLARHRAYVRRDLEKSLCRNAKRRARDRNLEFRLCPEDIVIPKYCPLLGVRLAPGTRENKECSPTLDRIDPTKGYTPDNVWVISHRANSLKSNASFDELRLLVANLRRWLKCK